jgi:hypothetical protein
MLGLYEPPSPMQTSSTPPGGPQRLYASAIDWAVILVMAATQSSGVVPPGHVSFRAPPEFCSLTCNHPVADVLRYPITKSLLACCLRNVMFEVRSSEGFVHNSLAYLSSYPHSTVLVVLPLAVREIPHSRVYIDVSWAGIKVIATFNVPLR